MSEISARKMRKFLKHQYTKISILEVINDAK